MNYNKACEILEMNQKNINGDVKKAYFRMALKYHPDKYKEDNGEKFKEIKDAYDFLSKNYKGTKFFIISKKLGCKFIIFLHSNLLLFLHLISFSIFKPR